MSMMKTIYTFGIVLGFAATASAQDDVDLDAEPSEAAPAEAAPAAAPADAGGSASVSASDVEPGKFVLGLRLGYGLPMGDAMKDSKMSDGTSGMIPIWLDLGYMVTPNIMLGLYGQYGIVSVKDCPSGTDCSASDIRIGLQGQYHIMPTEKINPWVGLGVGYEILSGTESAGGVEQTSKMKGMEYVNLQAGADFRVAPMFGVGPFLSFSLGQYGSVGGEAGGVSATIDIPSDQTAMHEWLTFGVRGAFNL